MDACASLDSPVLKFSIFTIFGFINHLKILLNIVNIVKTSFRTHGLHIIVIGGLMGFFPKGSTSYFNMEESRPP